MENLTRKSVAVFSNPFKIPGFAEILPAGEYDIATDASHSPDRKHLEAWMASVLGNLHPRVSHPGLARTLTESLADMEGAQAEDKLTGRELAGLFPEEMLADPMVRLVMAADRVSEMQLRQRYSSLRRSETGAEMIMPVPEIKSPKDDSSIEAAENEGMPTRPN